MPFEKILVADDELMIRKSIADLLRSKRYSVVLATNLGELEKHLHRDKIDLLFLDISLPDSGGLSLLEKLGHTPARPVIIVMSSNPSIDEAVECTRLGAFDYIPKPFAMSQIEKCVEKACSFTRDTGQRNAACEISKSNHLIGNSHSMLGLKQLIHKVAPTEATVLICGENGTGKELVANGIHSLSSRANGPFIKINCAAISETLIESEFFGHEKGAYTGATDRREGRFELADGGTLLLDEISEIPPNLQAKLLRVLQEREFERVGGTKTIKVDVRILATTNRDLKKAVANGEFREDLYYRLNVFPLFVPPLSDRVDDIPVLAETFLNRASKKYSLKIPGFALSTIEGMMNYPWPGNVRELQNCIERAAILSTANNPIEWETLGLSPSDLRVNRPSKTIVSPLNNLSPSLANSETPPLSFKGERPRDAEKFPSLAELEKQHILDALGLTGGNRTHAATLLGISIRTLRNKLNEYKLSEVAA